MNFLEKRFIKAVLEEDFDWLTDISQKLEGHLTIKHTKSFDKMKEEIIKFVDGKINRISEETAEFTSAFLRFDAKYLERITGKIGPSFIVWILSRVLLFGSKPAWEVLLDFENKLKVTHT